MVYRAGIRERDLPACTGTGSLHQVSQMRLQLNEKYAGSRADQRFAYAGGWASELRISKSALPSEAGLDFGETERQT